MLEGVRLMLIGMGIVFGFLVALVFVMKVMSRFALSMAADADITSTPPAVCSVPDGQDPQQLTTVITAAIARYRRDRASRR